MASAVSTGIADVGVGIEKAAKIVGIDFVPLITERNFHGSAIKKGSPQPSHSLTLAPFSVRRKK
ncbi:hypothetical protein AM1BK_48860 [Neobacillus kokaensis]|uniref:PBP domain-containing protein n=1 Tax=Neobacillus kokaensis TaxID=2759023 RepID=A0ABQ3NBR9_9BACI|nr:hypothetical protein AM1BK_48860 [Neobacillus kokaensis]